MSEKERFLAAFDPLPEGLPPRILLAYEPESCLARREDRSVWRLRRRADGAPFVLKTAPAGTGDLMEEFRILARLSPLLPGAVPSPVDCFQEDGVEYLLRVYLPGETLARYRERQGGCTARECVRLGRKLCALLETLHSQTPPVIHRDIKPENIILLPNGEVGLIDFGIARQYKAGRDTDTRRMGTRSTAAPEQYGYAQTDRRTDVYALGMTLIWLLTGAYDREGLAKAPGLPPRLRRTLEKAVSFAPEDRYPDVAAFSAALAGRRPRRKAGWLLPAAVLLCVLAVGAGLLRQKSQVVAFTSRSMEAAVRQELQKPEGPITYDELAEIGRLAVVGGTAFPAEQTFDYRIGCYIDNASLLDEPWGDITDLSLLAHMPRLRELYLCRQEITDISVLAGLDLTTLALCENRITDLSPLASQTNLETLYLGGNPAADYSVLSGLTNLRVLNVEGSVRDAAAPDSLEFLNTLILRELGLGRTVPKDGSWAPLTSQTALYTLHLWGAPEAAVEAANTLPSLKVLTLGDYSHRDLTPLSGLGGLEVLSIYDGLESFEGARALESLLCLAVLNSTASDLTPLAGMERLDYLQLTNLPISDFSPLAELPALAYVQVDRDQLAAVEAACPDRPFQLEPN